MNEDLRRFAVGDGSHKKRHVEWRMANGEERARRKTRDARRKTRDAKGETQKARLLRRDAPRSDKVGVIARPAKRDAAISL